MTKKNVELSAAGKSKRDNLKKMAIGAAYAVPVIATIHVGDMATNEANAYGPRGNGGPGGNPGGGSKGGGGGKGGSGGKGGGGGKGGPR